MRYRLAGLVALAVLPHLGGCGGRESLVTIVGRGVVNDPRNKSLRFDLLEYGLTEFCWEMTRRGTPLKLNDPDPVIGRFFADSCSSQPIDEDHRKSLVVQYSGRGYAWTAQTQRIGFTSAGVVEYAPDFLVHGNAMYVYFRPQNVSAASFETQLVESGAAGSLITMFQVPVNDVGRHIVEGQLKRGFTVIRQNDTGEVDFALGYVPLGDAPIRPFRVQHSKKLTLANDGTEIHSGQQDFIGGFEVTKRHRALTLTMTLDGTPTADVFLVPKSYADQMVAHYVTHPGPAPLVAPPIVEAQLSAAQALSLQLPVPPGIYCVVVDHSDALGRATPPATLADDRAAKVDYLVQLGRAK